MNEHVQKWIAYFTKKDRERFARFLASGRRYREVVESVLEENDLPRELYYLAMIESGYQNHATSPARAAGAWQFIPATGRRYGLIVDRFVDERRDPIRATEAAARYLKDLHNVFGSWHLAMAAYNAGEYRIVGAVVKGKSRDFWALLKSGVLPRETGNYVPKFLAAVEIGENPEKYGFRDIEGEKYPDLEAVEVPSPVYLRDVAAHAGVSVAELTRVNPHLRGGMTPASASSYEVWVPEAAAKRLDGAKARLAAYRLRVRTPQRTFVAASDSGTDTLQSRYHVVRKGESLRGLAKKYHVSVSYLKRVNGLHSGRVLAGARIRVMTKSYHPGDFAKYHVRNGDTISGIAKRFGMTVRTLKKLNAIQGTRVHAGQVLHVN